MDIAHRACALFAFGLSGLGLIIWQPQGHTTINESQLAYFLATSSGAGLKLDENVAELPNREALSCNKVFSLGANRIGARCISHRQAVAIER